MISLNFEFYFYKAMSYIQVMFMDYFLSLFFPLIDPSHKQPFVFLIYPI